MTIDLSLNKIEVFPEVNDTPVAPTATKGCNGSYLVSVYNALIDELGGYLNEIQVESQNLAEYTYNSVSAEYAFAVSFTHWHSDSLVTRGSQTLLSANYIDQPYSTVTRQEPSADKDAFKFTASLKSGDYKLLIIGRSDVNAGQFKIYLNDVLMTPSPIDMYSDTPAPFFITIPLQIVNSGIFTFLIKNEDTPETGFALPFTKFTIRQS